MQSTPISTYSSFVKAGRPYVPEINQSGKLMLPNFSTSPDSTTLKHKRRLVINSGIIYNRAGLCVAWVACQSCQGFRWRYLYFRGQQQITWHKLSWDEKRKVVAAYDRKRETIPFYYAPTRNYKRWLSL